MKRPCAIMAALLLAIVLHAQNQPLPLSAYRLHEAPTDSARYLLLRQAHLDALAAGVPLDYSGTDTLRLAIPAGAEPIPLGSLNHFANTVFSVRNNSADLFLFALTPAAVPLAAHATPSTIARAIDSGNFAHLPPLDQGRWLLHIVDSTPWVDQRLGYAYGHHRCELLRLTNGRTADRPDMPYLSTPSLPRLYGRPITDDTAFYFGHLTLLRDSLSTCKTFLLNLEYQLSATICSITVVTPASTLVNDRIIRIHHCANVTLNDITLLGSYSRSDHSGYGLQLDNLRDTRVLRLHASSPWGIFGTNNMHHTTLEHCNFNRFDIHCYGRDVTFRHCLQQNSYNQFSSVFGAIVFDSCTLIDFTPVHIESSYHTHTPFVLLMHDCHWQLTANRRVLVNAGSIDTPAPPRPELQNKHLPDIFINGLTLAAPRRLRPLLFHISGRPRHAIVQSPSHIVIHRLATVDATTRLPLLSDKRVPLARPLHIEITNPHGLPLLTTETNHL